MRRAAPNKALGSDRVINGILYHLLNILLPSLYKLFNACLQQGYYPRHFKETITVILQKPGKENYLQPKLYRPIALFNTIGKALEAVIVYRLIYLADTHGLLPNQYIGDQKLASTKYTIYLLLQCIHSIQAKDKMALLFLLDISRAYNNICRPRLLYNLRK